MNLRTEIPKKKRGRPPTTYYLTFKGLLEALFLDDSNKNPEKLFNEIESFAIKSVKKGEIPAIVFDNNGGSFVAVGKKT
jgi:hypothetical protein